MGESIHLSWQKDEEMKIIVWSVGKCHDAEPLSFRITERPLARHRGNNIHRTGASYVEWTRLRGGLEEGLHHRRFKINGVYQHQPRQSVQRACRYEIANASSRLLLDPKVDVLRRARGIAGKVQRLKWSTVALFQQCKERVPKFVTCLPKQAIDDRQGNGIARVHAAF